MGVRLVVQRCALMAQAGVGVLLAFFAVVLAFLPHCIFVSAAPGSSGGEFCDTFFGRLGPIKIGLAVVATIIAVVDVTAALRPHSRAGLVVVIVQLPVVSAAGIAEVVWTSSSAGPAAIWAGALVIVGAAIIVIASPRKGLIRPFRWPLASIGRARH
jgi:hypothetical protein